MLKHILFVGLFAHCASSVALAANHVIQISIDGLHGKAISILGPQAIPNFFRLKAQGLTTDYARTDPTYTNTLPNHASMITGQTVSGGHHWNINTDPGSPITVHSRAGRYIYSIYDLVHDAGMSTSLFVSKEKFSIFDRSWDATNGASDIDGIDNGTDKIDRYHLDTDSQALVNEFLLDLASTNRNYAFIHIRDPDSTGHLNTWDLSLGSAYMNSIIDVDAYLGSILDFIESNPPYMNNTSLILVADHGGAIGSFSHNSESYQSHIIPFYLWGKGVAENKDIYDLNPCVKPPAESTIPLYFSDNPFDNGSYYIVRTKREQISVAYLDDIVYQPIRNGDSANAAASLLGLGSIAGSQLMNIRNFQQPADNCLD